MMTSEWGRDDRAGYWPPRLPQASLLAILAAIGVTVGCLLLQPRTPLQRHYLPAYIGSTLAASASLPALPYTLLDVTGRAGTQLALDQDVEPAGDSFVLSREGRFLGYNRLSWNKGRRQNAAVRDLLDTWIYGQSVSRLLRLPVLAGVVILLCALYVAIPADRQRARNRRHGWSTKGPQLVTPARFTRIVQGDGVVLPQTRPGWLGLGPERRAAPVILPRVKEINHTLIAGGTGAGKTTLIDEMLARWDDDGDTAAVIYDPGAHFVKKWWREERGDVQLNPLHIGCPYWVLGQETQSDAECLGIATALFPDRPGESNKFFIESPRNIVARMLETRKSVHELVGWMSNRWEVLQLCKANPGLVDDASLEDIMAENAPAQQSGVMAALNLAAQALRLCPRTMENGAWSAREWAKRRHGWIFITNTASTIDSLVPLQSLWLNLIIMRLMEGDLFSYPVRLVVDELPTLNRLHAMPKVLFEGRKSNVGVVLGFQGDKQLETKYGPEYVTMIGQCATAITLRQMDPLSAKRASDAIGDIEIERQSESRSDGVFRAKSTQLTQVRQREPLLMPSELSGLPNMRGFLKLGNWVTPLRWAYKERPDRCEGILPIPPTPARAVPDLTPPPPPQTTGPNPKPEKAKQNKKGGQVRYTSPKRQHVHEEV